MSYPMTMLQAYIECALWSSTDDETPFDEDHDTDDLAEATRAEMRNDCVSFYRAAAELLKQAEMRPEQAGHDFWLTRNRHGAGFWDRGLGKIGDELTKLAHAWGEFDLYVGDDGKIYGS